MNLVIRNKSMKTYVYLWQYVADFFPEWEMFHTEVAEI